MPDGLVGGDAAPPATLSTAPCVRADELSPGGGPLSWDAVAARYAECYCLLIKGAVRPAPDPGRRITLAALAALYESRWAVRHGVDSTWRCFQGHVGNDIRPSLCLQPEPQEGADAKPKPDWYASFVLEHSGGLAAALTELGATAPPLADPERIESNSNVFFFLGQNNHSAQAEEEAQPIGGYPGHVDKVDHIGTWHVQHCGSKLWCDARPSRQLCAAGLTAGEWVAGGSTRTPAPRGPAQARPPVRQPLCPCGACTPISDSSYLVGWWDPLRSRDGGGQAPRDGGGG